MKKGFTLMELLLTVTVMGVLAAIATPVFTNVVERARFREVEGIANLVATAAKYYDAKYGINTLDFTTTTPAQRWDALSLEEPGNTYCIYLLSNYSSDRHLLVYYPTTASLLYRYNMRTGIGTPYTGHSSYKYIQNLDLP